MSPDGVQGQSPCINSYQNFFQPPSAASGRRSRRARRAQASEGSASRAELGEGKNLVQTLCVKPELFAN